MIECITPSLYKDFSRFFESFDDSMDCRLCAVVFNLICQIHIRGFY